MKKPWTPAEVATVTTRYPHEKTERISADLGRTVGQVYQKAAKLGLSKSAEYMSSDDACRLRRGCSVENRFKPGMTPWNKGIKFESGGRSHEARFKPGSMPHNTSAIGDYRTTKDGILQRKISNNKGNGSVRWRGVHELVWVEMNGPLPPKHIVVFKPGMRTADSEEITIDRVECISPAENMRRNTVHNMPKELAELCQLRGALTRQINKRKLP